MNRFHSLPYYLHCSICGDRLPDGSVSYCRACQQSAVRRAAIVTVGGLIHAAGYVLPVAAAAFLFWALRAL